MDHLIEFSDGMLTLVKDQIIISLLRIFIQCIFSLIKSLQGVSCKNSCIQFTERKQSDKIRRNGRSLFLPCGRFLFFVCLL